MRSPDGKYSYLYSWFQAVPGLGAALEAARDTAYQKEKGFYETPVCPPVNLCFRALELVHPDDVRVVILGQDPYHTPGKASGLAFGYHKDYEGPVDSSLLNILVEAGSSGLTADPEFLSLEHWVAQGVLLLNTRLSVNAGQPLSHAGLGWEQPITKVLKYLADRTDKSTVWLLWGAEARKAAEKAGVKMGMNGWNVISTSHPCRYSNTSGPLPFTGSRCFDRANMILQSLGREPIHWR